MASDDLVKVWEGIVKIAQSDGRISYEESNLIKTILTSASEYETFLQKAIEDGEIDEEEKIELINLRAKLLDNAYREASGDQKISEDEYKIIEETLKILHKLETDEFNFKKNNK